MRKAFRIFAAFTLLAIYLSMTVGGDIASLTCNCRHHHRHHAENHAAACSHRHAHGTAANCPIDGFAFTDDCTCGHHSTEVALYTQPRTADDNDASRNAITVMAAALPPSDTGSGPLASADRSYGEYLIPPAETILACGISLRAPPASI